MNTAPQHIELDYAKYDFRDGAFNRQPIPLTTPLARYRGLSSLEDQASRWLWYFR